jgi:hypothetical protein
MPLSVVSIQHLAGRKGCEFFHHSVQHPVSKRIAAPASSLIGVSTFRPTLENVFRLFVSSQFKEDRLTKLVLECPFGKLDLGDQHGFDPVATLHDRGRNPKTPFASCIPREI